MEEEILESQFLKMEHKCEQLLVEENGAYLEPNSESCHRNSPLATLGKMNMKWASPPPHPPLLQIRNEKKSSVY